MKIRYAIPALALLALPAAASAHHAAVTCVDGTFVVTPNHLDLRPYAVYTDTTVTIVWSDGYHVTMPLPLPCEAPPVVVPPVEPPVVTTPAQPVVPVTPVIPVEPPVILSPPVRPPVVHNCAWLRRVGAGPRAYTRLGHYPGCVVPKKLTRKPGRRHPAVAG